MAFALNRKNAALLGFLRAAYVGLVTYLPGGLAFRPVGAAALAVAAAALALLSFEFGVLAGACAIALPLLAVSPLAGIVFIFVCWSGCATWAVPTALRSSS